MQILLMLAVALGLENTALVAFGPEPQRVRTPLTQAAVWLGPVFVGGGRLVTFLVAIALTAALWLFLYRTDLGRPMPARAANRYRARLSRTALPRRSPRA